MNFVQNTQIRLTKFYYSAKVKREIRRYKVRASVHQQCGSKVMIQLDRGRNKVDIQQGVIQHAYPSVFTILVNDERDDNQPQLLSFSYNDIITKDIRMKLC